MEKVTEPTVTDIEDTTLEIIKPKRKREYVLTEARALALERMKEGRMKKANEANAKKDADKAILEAVKSAKKTKQKKPVVVYESSSEDEPEIIIKKRRKPTQVSSPEPEPVIPFRLKRL